MIRRFSVALAAVALTSTIASGCSTFSKNEEAAKVGSETLSVDDFDALAAGLVQAGFTTPPENGEYSSAAVRGVLSRWIAATLVEQRLAAAGTPISEEARTTATTSLQGEASVSFDTLNATTKDFLVTELAGQIGLEVPEADIERTYDAGINETNLLCLRVAVIADPDEADDLYQQLLDGDVEFADVADENNPEGTASGNGGILNSPSTGSECFGPDELNAQVAQILSTTDIGVPSPPAEFSAADGSAQYVMFLQRPYAEVADVARPAIRQLLGPGIERRLIEDGKATVDSRYGMWDAASLTVLPSR